MGALAPAALVEVSAGSALGDVGRALIAGSQAALEAVYPPEECFSFSPEELAVPNAQFLIAHLAGQPVGCVALMDMGQYGEIKRLFVHPEAQGHSVGTALMLAAEDLAKDLGLTVLKLETGPELRAAVTIYDRLGYTETPAFGGYPDIDSNLFLEKRLT